jgi:hypothetical protein
MHPQVGKVGVVELGGRQRRCVIVWREGVYAGVRTLPDLGLLVLHADQVLSNPSQKPKQPPSSWAQMLDTVRRAWKALRFDGRKSFVDGPPVTSMGIVGWFRFRWRWYRAVALIVQGRSVYVRRAPDLDAFEVPLQDFLPEDCIEHILPTLSFSDRLTLKWSLRLAQIPYKSAPQQTQARTPSGLPPGHHRTGNLHGRK